MLRKFWIAMAGAASLAACTLAQAQTYPVKPVRLVDPFAPGAITSNTSRLIARKFQEQTGQPMVVDNKPGAGTNLGSEVVARSAPDGYTLLLGTSSLAINTTLYKRMTFDPIKDLSPIVLLVRTPHVLAVSDTLPVKSVRELL